MLDEVEWGHLWRPAGSSLLQDSLRYGGSPVNRGIPLTDAIRKKAIFHTSFSSRSSFFSVNVHDVPC